MQLAHPARIHLHKCRGDCFADWEGASIHNLHRSTTHLDRILRAHVVTERVQVALIWMRDVNRAAAERTPRGTLTRLASREIAEYHLNRYFEMVEVQLSR
jgi:hypothetical protein